MGMAFGAVAGAAAGIGPVAQGVAAIGLGGIGVGLSSYDIYTNGPNICNVVAYVLSWAGILGGILSLGPAEFPIPGLTIPSLTSCFAGRCGGGPSAGVGASASAHAIIVPVSASAAAKLAEISTVLTAIGVGAGGGNEDRPGGEDDSDGKSTRQEIRDIMEKPHLSEADMTRLENLMLKDIKDSGGEAIRRPVGTPKNLVGKEGEPYMVLYTRREELFHEWIHFDYWRQRGWPDILEASDEAFWAETNIKAYKWQVAHPEISSNPGTDIPQWQYYLEYLIHHYGSGGD
jgi:hypothetical protein